MTGAIPAHAVCGPGAGPRPRQACRLQRVGVQLAGADPHHPAQVVDEHLAVADLAGAGRTHDRLDHRLDLFGIPGSDGSTNLDLGAGREFAPGWKGTLGWGKQWVKGVPDADYTFWKLGVDKSFESGFGIGVAYQDNDLSGFDDAFVLSLSKSF